LLTHRDLIIFLVSVVLFHFGNAAMLPMAGQVLAQKHPGWDTISLSGCIIAAQLVMVGIAWAVGKAMAAGHGRKTIFLVALAVSPLRCLLFSFTANPIGVIAIQLLDGVAAGIFGVIAIVIAADVTRGTGRFNLAQGLVALSIGIGAGSSNLIAGYIVQWFGYPVGFLSLAVIAVGALVFFAVLTRDARPVRSPAACDSRRGGGDGLNHAEIATAAIVGLGTAGVIVRPWRLPEAPALTAWVSALITGFGSNIANNLPSDFSPAPRFGRIRRRRWSLTRCWSVSISGPTCRSPARSLPFSGLSRYDARANT
jgi:MFS family permease